MTRARTAASPSPTAYSTLRGRPVRALRYPLRLRIADWWAGRRDGRLDLSGVAVTDDPTTPALTSASAPWLAHDGHREQERHEHEQLAHQARSVHLRIRHETVAADLVTAEQERRGACEALDAVVPPSAEELIRPRATESRTAQAVVRSRRTREHDAAVLAPARRRLDVAQARVTALTAELHSLAGQLETLTEITTTRCARITQLHQQRRSVYRRAYLRALRSSKRNRSRAAVPTQTPVPADELRGRETTGG